MSATGPSGGQIIAGIFLLLFGICLFLVGGGCTILWLSEMSGSSSSSDATQLLLLSIVTAVTGMLAIWGAVKLFRGRRD